VLIAASPPVRGACEATAAPGRATYQIVTSAAETAGAARPAATRAPRRGEPQPPGPATPMGV
jgi:hypothetical protein